MLLASDINYNNSLIVSDNVTLKLCQDGFSEGCRKGEAFQWQGKTVAQSTGGQDDR